MRFRTFIPAIIANIAASLSDLLLISASAWLIATASLHPTLSSLSIAITLVRFAGISRATLRYIDRFCSHKIIFRFLDNLRGFFYRNAARTLPLKSGRSYEGEFLHSIIVSADIRKDFLPRGVIPLSTATVVTILLTLYTRQPLIPLIFITNIALALLFDTKSADDSAYRSKILDFNDGREEFITFGTSYPIRQLNHYAKTFGEQNFLLSTRQIYIDTAFKLLNAAAFFFILLNIAPVADTITLTVYSLLFIAILDIFSQIHIAINFWKKIKAHTIDFTPILTSNHVSTTNHAVEVKNLTFKYANDKIFDDFNLNIARGDKIAIAGESGAGKTTLLYLITGLFAPDNGKIALGGSIAASTFNNYVFSNSIRYNFMILHENITDEQIFAALSVVGLENFNIDAPIGEDAANLSGGERNRLQIALAIAKNADILILDEPTAGLDKVCASNLISNLISTQKSKTLIVITHDSNHFQLFRRVQLVH